MIKHALGVALASAFLGGGSVSAQTQPTPPDHYTLDERGVDLVRGSFTTVATDVVIGQPGNGGLVHARVFANGGWRDTLSGTIAISGSTYTVSLGAESEIFSLSGGVFTPASNTGATLTQSGSTFTFTSASGAVGTYSTVWSGATSPYAANNAVLITHRQPSGETLTYHWDGVTYCSHRDLLTGDCLVYSNATRVEAVTNNRGYMIKFIYASDNPPEPPANMGWLRRTEAIGINLAVDYCNPGLNACTGLTQDWPRVTYQLDVLGGGIEGVTDQSGRTTSYTYSSGLSGIEYPGSTSDDVAVTYTSGRVASVAVAGSTWTYAYSDSGSTRTVTTTNPGSPASTTEAVSNQTTGRLTSFQNELGDVTSYQYDGQRRLTRATNPEGNYTQYAYDGRGNVITVTHVAKAGSGLANIVVSAAYPSSCSNPLTCNQPTSITDARGNTTDFTYDAGHGGVLTITEPAPTTGAARPQTRFTYWTTRAWYHTAPGTISSAPTEVTLPRETRACVSGSSCTDAANEVVATIFYGSGGTTSPTNRLPTSINQRSGTSSVSASVGLTYTPNGDIASVDGPLSGTTDTTYYRYDAARQLVGVIGPDPDAGGALLRRAERNTYNPRGQVTLTEQGTVTGLTDPNWAAFATLQRQAMTYDGYGRPIQTRTQAAGGTTRTLTQVSYDARSRLDCVATRMNPSTFGSPPAACTLGDTGSFGQDRILRYGYDAASQVTGVTSGYGSGSAITQSFTWSDNGQLLTAQDGDGNLSTWVYDGFDRVYRLRFPNPSSSGSSTTDYEQYGYDANSNVTSYRTRANQTFATTYDNLNRATFLNAPSPMADVTYIYDNLGRATGASQTGHAMTFAWDALSRLTSQTDPLGTFAFQYDVAGRRIRITWPDAFYAQYDWNLYNQVTAVRENGATSGAGVLAQYAYDNLGRRSGITRGNGVPTTYGYDDVSRLTSIAHNLSGTAQDVTFTMVYNPASQVTSRTISNTLYAYQPANESTAYTINGRNEIAQENSAAFTYDANRNLTNDGVLTYAYDVANRMTQAGSVAMTYGPTGALDQLGARRVGEVGGERMGVFTTSTGDAYRRFVPGAVLDEAAGYYYGAGATSSSRRWPLTDHLGSVVAYADSAGAAAIINTFDEYGRPGSGNSQYLQYTGQLALSSTWGVQNYRNRFYNARIGRFMQTDPIGYRDGFNLYGYVGNDPLNRVDPWGLDATTVEGITITGRDWGFVMKPRPVISSPRDPGAVREPDWWPKEEDFTIVDEIIVTAPRPTEIQLAPRISPPYSPRYAPFLFSRPPVVPRPSVPFPRGDGRTPPGEGFIWRGPPGSTPGDGRGNWWNPGTGESLRPDLNHPPGIPPHWDYHLRPRGDTPGGSWRWFGPGNIQPKGPII